MKHIAIIITRMIPGGASKIVRQIIQGAKDKQISTTQYQFTLFTGTEDIDEVLICEMEKYCNIIKIPAMIRNIAPFKDFNAYKHLLCELRKGDFDIVHTHTSKAGFIGRLAAATAKIPIIIHSPHGTIYTTDSNIEGVPRFSFGKKILQMAERFAGKQTTILTTLSQHEKDICINLKLSKKENTVVIPNGINCAYFALTDQDKIRAGKQFGLDKKDTVIISIGRLSPEKGHAILIEAFAEINKILITNNKNNKNNKSLKKTYHSPEHLKLIIIGDGPEKENLIQQTKKLNLDYSTPEKQTKNQNKNTLKHKVTFAGHCCDIRKYLAIADIVVIPSLYEGFGIAIIEAMAAARPVIASNVGGIPEIITNNKNGFLVQSGSSCQITEKILHILTNHKQLKKIAKAAQKRAADFSEKNMLQLYFELYN